jgi:hypothetical protein
MLGMLQSLCAHFGLREAEDTEIDELLQSTDPENLFDDVRGKMSGDG